MGVCFPKRYGHGWMGAQILLQKESWTVCCQGLCPNSLGAASVGKSLWRKQEFVNGWVSPQRWEVCAVFPGKLCQVFRAMAPRSTLGTFMPCEALTPAPCSYRRECGWSHPRGPRAVCEVAADCDIPARDGLWDPALALL